MLLIHVLAALGLASSVAADYYIDNANSTVSYTASGTQWQTFSFATQNLTHALSSGDLTVDSSQCYNQNYAFAACTIQNNCQITFPFTGSGVSVFVMHAGFQGISASLTIDDGQSVTATMPAPAPPSYQTPNVLLFDLQSLPSADHTATINLLDWKNGTASLYFDYAVINESFVELDLMSTYFLPVVIPTSATIFSPTIQPVNASSTSSTTVSAFFSSTFTTRATHAIRCIGPEIPISAANFLPVIQSLNASSTTALAFLSTSTTEATHATQCIDPEIPISAAIYSPATFTATVTPVTHNMPLHMNVGTIVGGACGAFAVLISIVTAVIFLKRLKAHERRLTESYRLDPFTAFPSALACDSMVSLTVHPQTAQKAQMRLMSRNVALNYSRRLSDGESSDFHILSTIGSTRSVPDVIAGPSITDPSLHSDSVIGCRREDRSSSEFRESLVRDITPSPTSTATHTSESAPPPSYQTLDPSYSDASHSTS